MTHLQNLHVHITSPVATENMLLLFIIYNYIARSLIPKMDELKAVSAATKPEIICIVETLLDSVITDNELDLPDYQLFRLDLCGCGGGIAIYVHTFLSCKVLLQGGPFALEFLSLYYMSTFLYVLFVSFLPFTIISCFYF